MEETLMAPVWEILRWHHPGVLVALVNAGLLDPAFTVERTETIVSYAGRLRQIESLMAHDAYKRVGGAIRQVRWAS